MIMTLYQEYLFVVGKIKDLYKLHVEVNHRDIHTFYENKLPIFKLLFGQYKKTGETNIVVSFHIDMSVVQAVNWFAKINTIHPLLKIAESFIEDDKGEVYLGDDAIFIKNLKFQREVISQWLADHDEEEMREFSKSKIVGFERNTKKVYDSRHDSEKAIIEFEYVKKPDDDGEIH